jgi:GntR family transcriptional regulator/MocR family aminotransferase
MDKTRTNFSVLVVLRRDARIPLHRQIETSIRDAIRAGRLPRGSPLPPSRVLAADLGVSRGVVVEAYQQLASEGYLASYAGGYTQVAAGPAPTVAGLRLARETPPRIDLSYGRADVSSFPRAAWLRAIRGALASAPNDLFGYLAGSGVPELRTAIAGYLNRVRGTVAQPDQTVISTGYAQGIALLVGVLAARGATRLALEDPSSGDDALPAARAAGLEVTGIPVDRNGIRVDLLAASGADAVVLTPSHQWPTGSVLSAERRAAVLRWAAGSGAVVIEGRLRLRVPLRPDTGRRPAGHGPGPGSVRRVGQQDPGAGAAARVVRHAGAPGRADGRGQDRRRPGLARAGAARPGRPHRQGRVRPAPAADAPGLPAPPRRAAGRAVPAAALARAGRRVRRPAPGHLAAAGLDEATVVNAAAGAGVGIEGVTPYRISHPGPGGLIFGYATVSEGAIVEGIDILAGVVAGLDGTRPARSV